MNTELLNIWSHTLTAALLLTTVTAMAQEKGCLELKTTAETEQEYINEKGEKTTRFLPAAKVVPGDQVIWTVTAKNVCAKPAESIVIANPVPEHMTYIGNSAMGTGTEITYSVDGKDFKSADELVVRAADGSLRPARPDEYRYLRWSFRAAFPAQAVAFVRYRAVVN